MEPRPSGKPVRKRLSLSKQDLTAVAAAELIELLDRITADGKITLEEATELREWLASSDQLDIPGITYLRGIIDAVLADGHLSQDEHKELFRAVEKVLPPELRGEAKERRRVFEVAEKLRLKKEKDEERERKRINKPVMSIDSLVVGGRFRGIQETQFRSLLAPGRSVTLYLQPDNPHDPNAIMVVVDSIHVGYLQREIAASASTYLCNGYRYQAWVTKVLEGRHYPLPVVAAPVYYPEATHAGLLCSSTWPTPFSDERNFESAGLPHVGRRSGCLGCASTLILPVVLALMWLWSR